MNRPLTIACVTLSLSTAAFAQDKPTAELGLPWGVTRLASPDGAHVLLGAPYQKGVKNAPLVELWIENTRTKQRQMVLATGGTLSAFWSPDGSAFVVNPGISDQAQTYIYDAATLTRLDVGREILRPIQAWRDLLRQRALVLYAGALEKQLGSGGSPSRPHGPTAGPVL